LEPVDLGEMLPATKANKQRSNLDFPSSKANSTVIGGMLVDHLQLKWDRKS